MERNWEWKPSQCLNQIEPASDTPEKLNDFIEQFRLYFAHLARKYPERTLFTEGRDPIQDELVGLHHLAEASDTPARTEWVEKVESALTHQRYRNHEFSKVCTGCRLYEEALALMKGKTEETK